MNILNFFKKKRTKMSFKEAIDLTELPVVTFIINDNKYNFLLDTGCTISIINASALATIENAEMLNKKGVVFGMEGKDVSCMLCKLNLSYKDSEYEEEFQILDMDESFKKVKQSSGVSIHGILGTIFFQRYKYILNFEEMVAESR